MMVRFSVRAVILACCVISLLTACDNSLDPVNRQKGLYSLYGSLNVDKDTNYIRIKNLNTPFVKDSTRKIDANVSLRNLDNGASEVMSDSVVKFKGIYTHNFYTTMDIEEATDYELSIRRSDGKSARALATTPEIADVQTGPEGQTCYSEIEMRFQPVAPEDELNLSIGFDLRGERYWAFPVPERVEDNTLVFRFTPKDILDRVFNPFTGDGVCCFQLSNSKFYVKYTHFGPNYLKGTTDTLAIPGGTGRFGGLYDRSYSFPIDTAQIRSNPRCI